MKGAKIIYTLINNTYCYFRFLALRKNNDLSVYYILYIYMLQIHKINDFV